MTLRDSKCLGQDSTDLKAWGRFESSDWKDVTIIAFAEENIFVKLKRVFKNITGLLSVSLTLCYVVWSRPQQQRHPWACWECRLSSPRQTPGSEPRWIAARCPACSLSWSRASPPRGLTFSAVFSPRRTHLLPSRLLPLLDVTPSEVSPDPPMKSGILSHPLSAYPILSFLRATVTAENTCRFIICPSRLASDSVRPGLCVHKHLGQWLEGKCLISM